MAAPSRKKNYHNRKGITEDLREALDEYGAEVLTALENVGIQTAEAMAMRLRTTNQPPASSGGTANPSKRRMWKRYAASWDYEAMRYPHRSGLFKVTVYNKRHYQLTHLLENGHRTRNGQMTRAFKHIEPIADEYLESYLERVEKEIKNK